MVRLIKRLWQLVQTLSLCVLITAALAGPYVLVELGFSYFIDTPGCTAECEAHGSSFARFTYVSKQWQCNCADGMSVRSHYTLTGSDSTAAHMIDGLFRLVVSVLGLAAPLLALLARLWVEARRERPLDVARDIGQHP